MQTKTQVQKAAKRLALTLLIIYLTPLGIYGWFFGASISSSHNIWAEFGAMSGIYAPIVALTTLAVLLVQVGLQKQINDHQYDQAYISQARIDLEFYAKCLSDKMAAQVLPGVTVRQFLHREFQPRTLPELDSTSKRELAANLDAMVPSIFGMWTGLYPILAGLQTNDLPAYRMTLSSSIQKLIAILSFETCAALENFHRTRTEGKLKVAYQFSPLIRM
jgi:hypothetical protein